MHLAGRIVDALSKRLQDKGKKVISTNLQSNKDTIMAAGFLHDVAHGPFSQRALETWNGPRLRCVRARTRSAH